MIKKIIWSVLVGLMSLALLAAAAGYWAVEQVNTYGHTSLILDNSKELDVKPGTTVRQVVRQLAKDGVLSEDWRFKGLLWLHPEMANIRAGLYELTPGETLLNLLDQLHEGKVKNFSLTLVEGQTIAQWQAQLAHQPHLRFQPGAFARVMAKEHASGRPEGRFFPDTYHYSAGQSADEILTQSYLKMQQELEQAWAQRDKSLPLKTPYDLLTLASIVEKETGQATERGWVAAVFVNRLRKGMRLQTDPTVIYGMGERYRGNITKRDLREKTPYNTYRINGLPPTPIAAPSLASLQAAANPAKVSYLYFVSRNDGSHVFSNTLKEHNRAVNKFQRNQ